MPDKKPVLLVIEDDLACRPSSNGPMMILKS